MNHFRRSFFSKSIHVLIACMLLFSCKNEIEKISSFAQNDTIPVEKGIDVKYLYSENAIVTTIMTAPLMNRYEIPEPFIELPKGFKVEMFDSLGNPKSIITAKWARKFEQSQLLEAKYNVVVVDCVDNKTLNTQHLIWDEANDKIYSDKFVKITTPDKIIFGDGFESDQNFNEYIILQPKGEILLTRDKNNDEDNN